jgi:hypothetical protein
MIPNTIIMKIVKVTYTTTGDFAEINQANIKKVMTDLQALKSPGINYTACTGGDGKTFLHMAFFASEADQKILNELPSFRHFQQELKASKPEKMPEVESLTIVGSSAPIFNQ